MNKNTDSEQLLDYPFDLYQRSRNITEVVEVISRRMGKERLRILDVGGFRIEAEHRETFLLKEFMPQHDIYALDREDSWIPGYVKGDGTCLPFKDGVFDVVLSSDVLEHIPGALRTKFIDNLLRVSNGFVILGAPFYSPKSAMAEEILLEYVRKVLKAEQTQLKEHIDNQLPRVDMLTQFFESRGLNYTYFDSGNLDNWLMMMMVKHYLMTVPESGRLHNLLDRYYNSHFYESDHGGEGYRKVFLIAKGGGGEVLQEVKERFAGYAQTNNAPRWEKADWNHIRMMLDLEDLRTRGLLAEKDKLIQEQAQRIHQLDTMRTMRLYRLIHFFTGRMVRPFSRVTRSLFSKVQLVLQVLTGRRKHPYLSFSDGAYRRWLKAQAPSAGEMEKMQAESRQFSNRPLISIVMPVYNTNSQWIAAAVQSVQAQVYDNWELCIVDDGSTEPQVRQTLKDLEKADSRVRVHYFRRNRGIAEASNRGLAMAGGEFIAFMDSDDCLHSLALSHIVKLLNNHPEADVFYTDEDKLTLDGERRKPVFKSDWSPQLFLTYNYINHLTVIRKSLIDRVGGFRSQFDWSQDYDLYLRVTEQTQNIFHIPQILYHWRAVPGSSASRVDIRAEALACSKQLLTQTLHRRGLNGVVTDGLRAGTFKIKYLKN